MFVFRHSEGTGDFSPVDWRTGKTRKEGVEPVELLLFFSSSPLRQSYCGKSRVPAEQEKAYMYMGPSNEQLCYLTQSGTGTNTTGNEI